MTDFSRIESFYQDPGVTADTKLPKNNPFYISPLEINLYIYFQQADQIQSDDELLRLFDSLKPNNILGLFYSGSKKGQTRLIKFILDHNIVDSFSGPYPGSHYEYHHAAFIYAIRYGHLEIVRMFLDSGKVSLTRNNGEALKYAIDYGHHHIVQWLKLNE